MHIEQVHFDEIFDAQSRGGDFSFKSTGRTEYGVRLGNGVVPREGTTYAVAFAEPGDWSTVLGWRDLACTAVTLRQSAWSCLCSELSMIFILGPAVIGGGLLFGGPGAALAVSALIGVLTFILIRKVVGRNRQVGDALRAVKGRQCPAPAATTLYKAPRCPPVV